MEIKKGNLRKDIQYEKRKRHSSSSQAPLPLPLRFHHASIYPLTSHLSPNNDPLSSGCPTFDLSSYIHLPPTIRVLTRGRTFRGITIPAPTPSTIQLDAFTLPCNPVTLARTDGCRRTRDIRQRRCRARAGAIGRTERAGSDRREIGF